MTRRCFTAGGLWRASGAAPLATALLLAAGLTAPALQARDDRARVLIVPGPAPDWVRRVRGQLSDLPASIQTLSAAVQDLSPDDLRQRLEQLAEQEHVELVASIVRVDRATGDPTEVAIWFAESERFYLRPLAEDWSHLSAPDRSGALELAALSVRSAVRALTLDPAQIEAFAEASQSDTAPLAASGATASAVPASGAEGFAAAASAAAPASTTSPDPSPADAPPVAVLASAAPIDELPAAQPEPSPASSGIADVSSSALPSAPLELHWSSELGMVGYMQGEPALAAVALQGGMGLASGAWELSVLGQLGVPSTSALGPATLELQRYALLARVDYSTWSPGRWQLGPLLRAGVTLTERDTRSESEALAPSHSVTQRSLLLGAGWSSEYRWSEQLGFFLRGVLDWQPAAGKYAVVTTTGEPVASAEAWVLQPSLELGGNWHW